MPAESFLDTNVLVYAAAGRDGHEAKRRRALELIDSESFGVSAQVLQEFYVTVTRKLIRPLQPPEALEWIDQLRLFPCAAIDAGSVVIAAELSVRHGISYWDAAILAAAESLGATTLWSEDLADGRRYDTVTVRNPFA